MPFHGLLFRATPDQLEFVMDGANLEAILKAVPPRDSSGSRTVGRYGFQANVAILKLLELHEGAADFRVVFDTYDDVVVLEPADVPTSISLYQVKSRDPGQWATSDLCAKVGKTKPRSIASRLYAHVDVFGASIVETGFITNAPYKVKIASGDTTSGDVHRIVGPDIHPDDVVLIAKAVAEDDEHANVPNWLPKLVLIRTTLGVHGQDLAVIGRLHEHLAGRGCSEGLDLKAIYETLHGSIDAKTGFSQVGLDPDEITKRKSLTRLDFQELLDRAEHRKRGFLADWDIILHDLQIAGFRSIRTIRVKSAAMSYNQKRFAGHPQATRFKRSVEQWKALNTMKIGDSQTIVELASLIGSELEDRCGYEGDDLFGALVVEAHEAIHA